MILIRDEVVVSLEGQALGDSSVSFTGPVLLVCISIAVLVSIPCMVLVCISSPVLIANAVAVVVCIPCVIF